MAALLLVTTLLALGRGQTHGADECVGDACVAPGAAEYEESALLQGHRAPASVRRVDPATGGWGPEELAEHVFDAPFADSVIGFLERRGARSVTDMGCGLGNYSRAFVSHGFQTACYDLNPATPAVSGGLCGIQNLADKDLNLQVTDYVMSLEVGEHIPKELEGNFLDNIAHTASRGVILSWALVGQHGHGHVNCQWNNYVIKQMEARGFTYINEDAEKLRDAAHIAAWLREDLMVFEKS